MTDRLTQAADALREATGAVRLQWTWFGVRRTCEKSQVNVAADALDARPTELGLSYKVIDTKHNVYKRMTKLRGQITQAWELASLPFPERATRLIRRDQIPALLDTILGPEQRGIRAGGLRSQLLGCVDELSSLLPDIKSQRRAVLGQAYRESDYPNSFQGQFDLEVDFPNVDPPSYLARLAPAEYEAQKQAAAARFLDTVKRAEDDFAANMMDLMTKLREALTPQADGTLKRFCESKVANIKDLVQRFKSLNFTNNEQLDTVMQAAESLADGAPAAELKADVVLRQRTQDTVEKITEQLSALVVNAPRRTIKRKATADTAPEPAAEPALAGPVQDEFEF